jgi:hypothetical protein
MADQKGISSDIKERAVNNFAVPRRSALQIIEHVSNISSQLLLTAPNGADASRIKLISESDLITSLTIENKSNVTNVELTPDFLTPTPPTQPQTSDSAPERSGETTEATLLDSVTIYNRSPLRLLSEISAVRNNHVATSEAMGLKTLLVCWCDPDMPGAYWTMAGPAADADEVDLMASSSLFVVLKNLKQVPNIHQTLLMHDIWVFRVSEGAKLATQRSEWIQTSILLVPFLPNSISSSNNNNNNNNSSNDNNRSDWPVNSLARQFRLMMEVATRYQFDQMILPMGRWARANGNALEVTLRLTQALETMKKSTSTKLKIMVSCPPEQAHWQHSVNSTINSAKTRIVEQKQSSNTPTGTPTTIPTTTVQTNRDRIWSRPHHHPPHHHPSPFSPVANNSIFAPPNQSLTNSLQPITSSLQPMTNSSQPITSSSYQSTVTNTIHRPLTNHREGFRRPYQRRERDRRGSSSSSSWDRIWNAPQKIWDRLSGKKH